MIVYFSVFRYIIIAVYCVIMNEILMSGVDYTPPDRLKVKCNLSTIINLTTCTYTYVYVHGYFLMKKIKSPKTK